MTAGSSGSDMSLSEMAMTDWRTLPARVPSSKRRHPATVGQGQRSTVFVVAIALTLILAGCGNVAAQDVPPAGQIWFGSSFDPQTFAIADRRVIVGTQEPLAFVAHLTESIEGSVNVRASYNGTFVGATALDVTGSGDVFGSTLGALLMAGQWTYEMVDIGGNVLASGTLTAQ